MTSSCQWSLRLKPVFALLVELGYGPSGFAWQLVGRSLSFSLSRHFFSSAGLFSPVYKLTIFVSLLYANLLSACGQV